MSTDVIYTCMNPGCDKIYTVHGHLLSHIRQSAACSQWLEHMKEVRAGKQRLPDATVVPGSIHDLNARHFSPDPDDDPILSDTELDDPMEPLPSAASGQDADGSEYGYNDDGDDEEDEELEDAAREALLRDWIHRQSEHDDLLVIDQPDIIIGQPGPGPTTLRARLGRMIGAHARTFDEVGDSDSGRPDDIIEHHPSGGVAIRLSTSLYERWEALFGVARVPENERMDGSGQPDLEGSLYHPFASKLDWDVAQWMVSEGIGHGSFNRLLEIDGLRERLGLSYRNTAGLHEHVDAIPRRAGQWYDKHITFPDRPNEVFILRHRDIIECIRSLWGDPELSKHIVYKPCKLFQKSSEPGTERGSRLYNEMWTGQWWWFIQDKLPIGNTLAPVIIATDKTQLTQFRGNKQAYPVYLTLGNIPGRLRRKPSQQACILVGYLPIEKAAKPGLSKRGFSGRQQLIFHAAMRHLLEPLVDAGKYGVEMTSGNGDVHRVHPILAAYVADYPEQCLVTCSKYGTCPKCKCGADNLHDYTTKFPLRTQTDTAQTMQNARSSTTSASAYYEECMEHDVNGHVTTPFWSDLPYTDIHMAQTPDVLHQLYQGVIKHLVKWCQVLGTEKELDRRIRRLPPALGLRHFNNGISALSQVSGTERKNIGKILLGCIIDLLPIEAVTACRAILDFVYLAQYTTHDEVTLSYMEDALDLWNKHKDVFIRTEVRDDLDIPKFHALRHYVSSIRLFGATNNFNTEMFERLHIEFAKKGWRASNKRDEFPQMTQWVARQENVQSFKRYLVWVHKELAKSNPTTTDKSNTAPDAAAPSKSPPPTASSESMLPNINGRQSLSLSIHPSKYNQSPRIIGQLHGVPQFPINLCAYLNGIEDERKKEFPEAHTQHFYTLPFRGVNVWYSFRFSHEGFDGSGEVVERDWVKASPLAGGRFDTVVVLAGEDAEATSLIGTRIGRVRVIFKLPKFAGSANNPTPFPHYWPKTPLAYIEWYSRPTMTTTMGDTHNMASLQKVFMPDGQPQWSIIPLSNIRQSTMLIPNYKKTDVSVWDTDTCILDTCTHFRVNNYLSLYSFQTVYL
ncbi:hypothetical protein CYLTODRAFT_216470 [Cylindrobasidium torrendii FP15055 ss-10]|uniref:C2H2-type domain-containing protein n=1 Tax=Cylindrobasidium torrendii FP15055 ss-10 TaxID=1314674 RepID=A0A0D7BSE5_9AGAR|nr:hypothetical protein CYLTODRAFT_216470 [Cylindrobasidium torrendii FP15055 ss-10]